MAISPENFSRSKSPITTALSRLLHEIGLLVIGGFVATLVLIVLFAELTEGVFSNETIKMDDNFELWVHSWANPALNVFFQIFTDIGGFVGVPILAAVTFGLFLWRRKFYFAWLLVLGVGGGMLLNQVLKAIFHRTRPDLWHLTVHEPTSYSFPSGHATASICYFGLLAWFGFNWWKRPLARTGWTILMIFIIVMVGLSRIYFGVHYPTDVLAAYLTGGTWLIILLEGGYIWRHLHNQPPPQTIKKDAE